MENNKQQNTHDDHDTDGGYSHVANDDPNQGGNAANAKDGAQKRKQIGRWERYKQSWKKTAGWNKIMVLLTAVIAMSTGLYSCYERKQLGVMAGQLIQMESSSDQTNQLICLYRQQLAELQKQATDTHELAAQAKNQADRTKELGDRTLQAMRIDERAWVGFSSPEPPVLDRNQPFVVYVPLQNTGKTPAIHFTAAINVIVVKADAHPSDADLDKRIDPFMGKPVSFILPNDVRKYRTDLRGPWVDLRMPDWAWEQINDPQYRIIVFGKTIYSDIFGFEHRTRYCESSNPDPLEKLKFRACGFYSGIDTEKE